MIVAKHRSSGGIGFTSLALASAMLLSFQSSAAPVDLNRALSEVMAAYREKNYDKAIESLSSIIKAAPDASPETVLYTLGFAYHFQFRHQDAADTFLAYLEKYPDSQNSAEVHLILGRSLLELDGKADAALDHLAKASDTPEFAEEARFLAADAYIKKGDTEKAAEPLQNAMKAKSSGPNVLRAALQLVDLYIADSKFDEAVGMLRQIENSPGYPDVIVTVNNRFVQIGDARLEARSYASALEAYSSVRPQAQVMAIQLDRLKQMRSLKESFAKRIDGAAKSKQPLPRGYVEKAAILASMIENTDKLLGELRKIEGYDSIIQYRVGRCYFNMDRFWPASVAFEAFAGENQKSDDASTSLYGAVVCQWRLERGPAARKLCGLYLERYPTGEHFATVAELNATVLQQEGLNEEAIAFLASFIEKNPNLPARQKLLTLLANTRFQAGNYDDAAANYDTLRGEFGAANEIEEYTYRRALCDFRRDMYPETMKSFEAFERAFPAGEFLLDVRYRRGVIQLALKDFDNLIAGMNDLLKDPNAKPYAGRIHTLLADAYSGKGDDKSAATEYANALRTANGDKSIIEYALEQATHLLRSGRRWEELEALWTDFLATNPGHPMTMRGVAELSKLLVRANRKDEARKMLSGHILAEIHNTRSEYVEMLLSQLAGLHVPVGLGKKDAPKPDFVKIEADLLGDLDIAEDSRTAASLARVLFARSELARMMRDNAGRERILNDIARNTPPGDLGPILLSMLGRFLLDTGEFEKAKPFYTRLRNAFPKSEFSDAAPVGLGEIALEGKDYEAALKEFDFALSPKAPGTMLKEAAFGKALALKGLMRTQEAKVLFEEIVTAQQWRGVEKVGSLFELGEIALLAGDKDAARVYFNKVLDGFWAYPEYRSKAHRRLIEMER